MEEYDQPNVTEHMLPDDSYLEISKAPFNECSLKNETSETPPVQSLDQDLKQDDESPSPPKKKKGRPKGAKNGTGSRATHRSTVKLSITQKERLPKMLPNVHFVKLSAENKEELKKRPYPQPGVCLKIAPELDMCKTCSRFNVKRCHRFFKKRQIDCRFYQFRILRYNETTEKLEVAGFLDPFIDPVEVDRNIWFPNFDKLRFKTLSVQNARLILTHVGEQLCEIMQKETMYYEKFKIEDKPVIWKRLIE